MTLRQVGMFLSFQALPLVFLAMTATAGLAGTNHAYYVTDDPILNVGVTPSSLTGYDMTTPVRSGLEFAAFFFLVGLVPSLYFTLAEHGGDPQHDHIGYHPDVSV